ncbi:MAG: tRNA 2-thiocytidine biosynthesis TtcA family protein [Treponema sp.]
MEHDKVASLIDKAVFDYKLIEDGDRILVGASGGKDSTLLVEYFSNRAKRFYCDGSLKKENSKEPNFSFKALTVLSEFNSTFSEDLKKLFLEWSVDSETEKIEVLGRLKKDRLMNCYWCSTQRRKELLDYAVKNHFNKIALGHHLDDILETLIMNMVEHGELSTMPVKLKYEKFPVTIIRPLCYVPVEMIVEHAEREGWKSATCTCTYQDNSGRKTAREKLAALTDGEYAKKMRLFNSLKNIQTQYLP